MPRAVEADLGGADPRSPYASPLYGDPADLPPTLIYVGGDEAHRDDAVRMAERLRSAGCEVELEVASGRTAIRGAAQKRNAAASARMRGPPCGSCRERRRAGGSADPSCWPRIEAEIPGL
jgi:acetyl esterase/lipase